MIITESLRISNLNMSKRTLLLILALLLLVGVLLVVAFSVNQTKPTPTPQVSLPPQTSPTPVAQTVLSMNPNPLTVSPQSPSSVNIEIATGANNVTAVQLEISFDPKVVNNVTITAGTFFANAIELIKKVDQKEGTITYALGISPNDTAKTGTGTVATITFTAKGAAGTQSPMTFSEKTLVTASGASSSILKSTTGTTVVVR